jgi:hypothetical protein
VIDEPPLARLDQRLVDHLHHRNEGLHIDAVLLRVLPNARRFKLRLLGEYAGTMEGAASEDLALK